MPKRLTTETFVQRAQEVHGNKYDYSRTRYKNAHTKIEIICPEHGIFIQKPHSHLSGYGCPDCGGSRKLSTEQFIQKAREVHGDKYDYSKVRYINAHTKIEIICPEHGSFFQSPNNHKNGSGCPECYKRENWHDNETFIQKAQQIHGDRYDYSHVEYNGMFEKIEIICPSHGSFNQTPSNHFLGHGCPVCANKKRMMKEEDFLKRAQEVHGNKYDYSLVVYDGAFKKVIITCPVHGPFSQSPHDHLQGKGCPKCVHRVSRGEQELAEALKSLEYDVIQSYRKWCPERPGLEIDIYLPEHQVGIEYNGEYWHQEPDKDAEKVNLALQQGIKIITVWESEWKKDKKKVLGKIERILEKIC